MSKLFYCCLPVLLLGVQFNTAQHAVASATTAHYDSSKNIMDSSDIRIFLESKKTMLYTVNNVTVATDKQDKSKKYIDGYEITASSRLNYKEALSVKTLLLDNKNYRFETSRCSFFPKYCISVSSKKGSLHFFLPETASCADITILKINSISNKETEFSFAKEILDKIKNK